MSFATLINVLLLFSIAGYNVKDVSGTRSPLRASAQSRIVESHKEEVEELDHDDPKERRKQGAAGIRKIGSNKTTRRRGLQTSSSAINHGCLQLDNNCPHVDFSCAGHCGFILLGPACSCDPRCFEFNDCCPDILDVCNVQIAVEAIEQPQ